MGGNPPLGYDVNERKLIINPAEAEIVKLIFKTFVKTRSIIATCEVVNEQGHKTKQIPLRVGGSRGGIEFAKNTIHRILKNRSTLARSVTRGNGILANTNRLSLWIYGQRLMVLSMCMPACAPESHDKERTHLS